MMQGSGVVGERERREDRETERDRFVMEAGHKELIRTKFLQHRTSAADGSRIADFFVFKNKIRIVGALRGRPADLRL